MGFFKKLVGYGAQIAGAYYGGVSGYKAGKLVSDKLNKKGVFAKQPTAQAGAAGVPAGVGGGTNAATSAVPALSGLSALPGSSQVPSIGYNTNATRVGSVARPLTGITNDGILAGAEQAQLTQAGNLSGIGSLATRLGLANYGQQQGDLQRVRVGSDISAGQNLQAMTDQFQTAGDTRAFINENYRPINRAIVQDAMNYGSPGRVAREAGDAAARVGQQADIGRENLLREATSRGVNTGSGNFIAGLAQNGVGEGIAKAAAANTARREVDEIANQRRLQASEIGQREEQNQLNQLASSQQAGDAMQRALLSPINASNEVQQGLNSSLNLGSSATTAAASVLSDAYKQRSGNIYNYDKLNTDTRLQLERLLQDRAQNLDDTALRSGAAADAYNLNRFDRTLQVAKNPQEVYQLETARANSAGGGAAAAAKPSTAQKVGSIVSTIGADNIAKGVSAGYDYLAGLFV